LTLIEEHGATWRLPESELVKIYRRAHGLLKSSQDAEDKERLLACAQIVIKRLSGIQIHDRNFSFYGAVHELEARLIEQALELEGGSITRAAERLGLKRQALSNMLQTRVII
jgi:DNA-binding NtrC family response regulator